MKKNATLVIGVKIENQLKSIWIQENPSFLYSFWCWRHCLKNNITNSRARFWIFDLLQWLRTMHKLTYQDIKDVSICVITLFKTYILVQIPTLYIWDHYFHDLFTQNLMLAKIINLNYVICKFSLLRFMYFTFFFSKGPIFSKLYILVYVRLKVCNRLKKFQQFSPYDLKNDYNFQCYTW